MQQSTCYGTLDKILSSAHSVNLPFELDPCSFPLCYNHISLKKAIKVSGLLEFILVFENNLFSEGTWARSAP